MTVLTMPIGVCHRHVGGVETPERTATEGEQMSEKSLVETAWGRRIIDAGLVGIGTYVMWAMTAANLIG